MDWTHPTYVLKRLSKYLSGNQAAGDHEEGQKSAGWTVEEGLHRAGISRYGITTGKQRVSLQETEGDRSQ